MCGIYFSLSRHSQLSPNQVVLRLLRNRGPDSLQTHAVEQAISSSHKSRDEDLSTLFLSFTASVLSLRGDIVTHQPLVDPETGSVLCWNGEAWRFDGCNVSGNDAAIVFKLLLEASLCHTTSRSSLLNPDVSQDAQTGCQDHDSCHKQSFRLIISIISSISGPFALIYYDAAHRRLFYGRDSLGRRSLLARQDEAGNFYLSSISDGASDAQWTEVEADGIYCLDLHRSTHIILPETASLLDTSRISGFELLRIPWTWTESSGHNPVSELALNLQYPPLNKCLPGDESAALNLDSTSVRDIAKALQASMALRTLDIPMPPISGGQHPIPRPVKIAILFSGGLDCSVLARVAHGLLPVDEPIDLLNVAFENPRVVAAAKARASINNSSTSISFSGEEARVQSEDSPYELCPDRVTARTSYLELQRLCPERIWRLVEIDIPVQEAISHRSAVISLMHPHNTEMDLSIAYAFYFAARGQGLVRGADGSCAEYKSAARVLFSGLGADEVFGGYTRHATAYRRGGYTGLLNELELDVNRLGKRNLGRDDRVISHWGKEVRFPYLDEQFLNWALGSPVWHKCGFGLQETSNPSEVETLEPGKRVLRLFAWSLGLRGAAMGKKRAIQFGARTAKMETGKVKGTAVLT